MNRVKKYLLSFAFLSFVFLGNVFADSDISQLGVNLERNGMYTILHDRYVGLSCEEKESSGTRLYKNGNDYVIKWKETNSDRASGTDHYNCYYDYLVGSSASSRTERKQIHITTNYGRVISEYAINIQLYKNYYETRNLLNDDVLGGISLLTDFAEVISVEQGTASRYNGNQYVSINCPAGSTTTCVISMKSTMPNNVDVRIARYNIKYKTNHGEEKIAKIDLFLYSRNLVLAYPGAYGTCDFRSGWTRNGDHYEYILSGDTINLPDCTSENSANPLITFRGWVNYNVFGQDNPVYRKLDVCQPYVVSSGGNFRHDPDKNVYMGCYIRTSGIVLYANGGELPRDSSYIERDGVIFVKKEGSVVLPEPTEIPGMYNMYGTGRFEGWEDSAGNIYPAGTTVAANGEGYTAHYSTGMTVSGEEVNKKMVFVKHHHIY